MGNQKVNKINELVLATDQKFNELGESTIIEKIKVVFAGTPKSDDATVGIQYHIDGKEHFHCVTSKSSFNFCWELFEAFVSLFSVDTVSIDSDENGNITSFIAFA